MLREQLAQPGWTNANVRVVVADQWVRYMIVPWEPGLNDDAERMAHARHLLAQAYGDMEDWTLTSERCACGAEPPGDWRYPRVCSRDWSVNSRRVAAASFRPSHVSSRRSTRRRRDCRQAACWFVAVDDGSLAAAHVTPQGWDRVHAIRIGNDWNTELQAAAIVRADGRRTRERGAGIRRCACLAAARGERWR